jgi:hypothetical protein
MESSKFEKGHKLNYKISAIKLKSFYISTLYDCEGDKICIGNSIHYYDEKQRLLEIPEWFYNLKFK